MGEEENIVNIVKQQHAILRGKRTKTEDCSGTGGKTGDGGRLTKFLDVHKDVQKINKYIYIC